MKINILTAGIIISLVIFGGIGSTMAMELWSTTSHKTPVKIKEGYAAGSYNPADIRGSYTFAEISKLFKIDLKVLFEAFNLPEKTDGNTMKSKDLQTIYETSEIVIGNESLQIFVALYQNLPIELDGTYIPQKAADLILQKNSQLTAEQKNYLETHTIDLTKIKQKNLSGGITPSSTEESENLVNGSTTFQRVLDAGISKKQIEAIIQDTMPSSNQTIKNFCIEKGLSFPGIKDQLNALAK